MEWSGLDTSCIRQLGSEYHAARTAQYVAVNDAEKSLVLAMADMDIFTKHSFPKYWDSAVTASRPKWLVVDGNWSPNDIRSWIHSARQSHAQVAFEPVSVAKSKGLFSREHKYDVYPSPLVDLAAPNQFELAAMYEAAKQNGYLDSDEWFKVVDAFGIHGGARDKFIHLSSADITNAGIPVQSIQLLPYIPTIIAKMGAKGALLTTLLSRDDPRLYDRDAEAYILTRTTNGHPKVGGVYMRYYPAREVASSVVSVNGVGDTFFGTLIAGLAEGGRVENLVDVTQHAAVLTLMSHESVSEELAKVTKDLMVEARR